MKRARSWNDLASTPDLLSLLQQYAQTEHDGSFTLDLDYDPTHGHSQRPAWWGRVPTPAELSSYLRSRLGGKQVNSHVSFRGLAWRYSASGQGAHVMGWARMRETLKHDWVPLNAGNTLRLRYRLGDDPKRLYFDAQRGDFQGWLSTANRDQVRDAAGNPTGEYEWRRAGEWTKPSERAH